jgi:hypothetical protein
LQCALARLHTRSVYGSLDFFGTFWGNAKKYIRNKMFQCLKKLLPPFVLKQKVEPKIQGRFNAEHSLEFITQADESSGATV